MYCTGDPFKDKCSGPREASQRLRVLAALAEDTGLVPMIYMVVHYSSSGLCGYQAYARSTYVHIGRHLHTDIKKN